MKTNFLEKKFGTDEQIKGLLDLPFDQRKSTLANEIMVVGQPVFRPCVKTNKVIEYTYLGLIEDAFFLAEGVHSVLNSIPKNAMVEPYLMRDLVFGINFEYPTECLYLSRKKANEALIIYLQSKIESLNKENNRMYLEPFLDTRIHSHLLTLIKESSKPNDNGFIRYQFNFNVHSEDKYGFVDFYPEKEDKFTVVVVESGVEREIFTAKSEKQSVMVLFEELCKQVKS